MIVEVLNVTLLSYFQVEVPEGIVKVLNVTLVLFSGGGTGGGPCLLGFPQLSGGA